MQDDGADMAEIEARLYAQVHHDSSDSVSNQVPQYTPAPVRLVNDHIVVNTTTNATNKQTANRYWLSADSPRPAYNGARARSTPFRPSLNPTPNSKPGQSKFAPYQSILSGMRKPSQPVAEKSPPPREKSPKKSTKKQAKQKFLNPMNAKNLSKIEQHNKLSKKRDRAQSAKSKVNAKQPTSPHHRQQHLQDTETICLDDSSDEEVPPNRSSHVEVEPQPQISNDDDDDDVIEIPVPPPPLVTIDDSSEESNLMQSPPKSKKKSNKKKAKKGRTEFQFKPSSRCVSPSNSSIMSDDFIGGNDRDLLRGIDSGSQDANEIDLQNDMTVEHLMRLRKMGKSPGVAKIREITGGRRGKDGPFVQPTDKARPGTSNAESNPPTNTQARHASESDTESSNNSADLTKNSNAIKDILASDFIAIGENDEASPSRMSSRRKRKSSREAHSDVDDSIYAGKTGSVGKKKAASEPETAVDSSDSDGDMDVLDASDFNRIPNLVRPEDENKYQRKKPNPFDPTYYEQDSFVTMLSNICHENFEEGGPSDDHGEMAVKNRNDNDTAILEEIDDIFEPKSDEEVDVTTIDVSDEEALPLVMDGNEPNAETILNTKYINPVAYQHEYFRGKKVKKPAKTTDNDKIDVGLRHDTETGPEKGVVQREIGWNEEMRRFYYESWGGESFDIRQILRSQATPRNNWHITNRDRFPYSPPNRAFRCRNCQEFGHMQSKCLAPVKKSVCHMCGQVGHREPRCPNKICLRCGSPARVYGYGCVRCRNEDSMVCALCRVKGHSINYCPDKWRRYYSTTIDNNVVVNDVIYNSRNSLYCSVCAGRGHHSNDCHNSSKIWLQKLYRTQIQSHTPTYPKKFTDDQETLTQKASKMSYALFTGQQGDFTFNYDDNVTSEPNFTFNRFKRAVGLEDAVPEETPAKRRKRKRKERPRIDYGEAKGLVKSVLRDFSFSEEMRKLDDEQQTSGDKFELSFITDAVKAEEETSAVEGESNQEVSPPGVTDEDSSYNFSEYFPKKNQTEEDQPKEATPPPPVISEESPDAAPDFIPLTAAEADNDEPTDDIQLTNVVATTEAKIFLSKVHCKILMGIEGTNFLNEASDRHDLFFRFVWQAFGNILLITGTRDHQDEFHTELIEYLKHKEDETYTKHVEMSTRVPKQRQKLIRFLEENIKSLDRDPGNAVKVCHNRLKFYEASNNRPNIDRMRRQLNVILLGRMGYKDGRSHLAALKANLVALQKDKITKIVSEEFRNEVQQHYNYIFSAFNHQNYADLVNQYQLVQFGDPPELEPVTSSVTGEEGKSTPGSEDTDKPESAAEQPEPAENFEPSIDEQFVDKPPDTNLSAFWSDKCTKIVEECREILGQLKNNKGIAKLEMVSQKAQNHQLTFNDYSSLLKILTKIKKNNE